ncbi:MAG: lysylphosphatidylglycerol synthase transmembrane domain-containing protein [Ectothiorhodospiraceae bacterium]
MPVATPKRAGSAWRRWSAQLLALVLTAGLAGAIQWWVGWRALLQPWQQLAPLTIAATVAGILLSHAMRAARVGTALPEVRGGFMRVLRLVLQHNLYNTLLPMRAGEASFPLLLRRQYNIPVSRSVATLVVFRTLDLHTILWLGLGAYAALDRSAWWLAAAVAALAALVPGWLVARALQSHLDALPDRGRLTHLLHTLLSGLPAEGRRFAALWAWSAANWLIKLAALAWALSALAGTGAGLAWISATLGDLSSVLPLHSWAGLGSYEAAVVAGLALGGLAPETALPAALSLHLLLLGTSLAAGLAAQAIPQGAPFAKANASGHPEHERGAASQGDTK